jgi:hypothetical protein
VQRQQERYGTHESREDTRDARNRDLELVRGVKGFLKEGRG